MTGTVVSVAIVVLCIVLANVAMMAGMSRLYAFPTYVLLISLAILPGPVIVLLSDLI